MRLEHSYGSRKLNQWTSDPEKNDAVQNQCSEEEIGCQTEDEGEDEEEEKVFPERNLCDGGQHKNLSTAQEVQWTNNTQLKRNTL